MFPFVLSESSSQGSRSSSQGRVLERKLCPALCIAQDLYDTRSRSQPLCRSGALPLPPSLFLRRPAFPHSAFSQSLAENKSEGKVCARASSVLSRDNTQKRFAMNKVRKEQRDQNRATFSLFPNCKRTRGKTAVGLALLASDLSKSRNPDALHFVLDSNKTIIITTIIKKMPGWMDCLGQKTMWLHEWNSCQLKCFMSIICLGPIFECKSNYFHFYWIIFFLSLCHKNPWTGLHFHGLFV